MRLRRWDRIQHFAYLVPFACANHILSLGKVMGMDIVTTSKDQHQSLTVVRSNVRSQEEFQQRVVGLS